MFLETRGYSVFPVSSGDEAIDLIKENPCAYDIVLLDEQMPGKDGLAALEEIRETRPDLPVVMVTANEKERIMEIALSKKIDGYLTKPVNPSQILLCCKRILDSKRLISNHLSQKYLRKFTENHTRLNSFLSISDWINLYDSLVKWDLELEKVDNEGLRQMHAGQKSDCNKQFCNFVVENYAQWLRGERSKPALMSNDIVEKVVVPQLRGGRSVLMVVLSGMRLDLFLAIEPLLRKSFSVNALRFVSSLPTTPEFCRTSLVSGEYPEVISGLIPGIFDNEANTYDKNVMLKLMEHGLKRSGMEDIKTFYAAANELSDSGQIEAIAGALREGTAFGVIVIDILNQFLHTCRTDGLLREATSDDAAFRKLIELWFVNSIVFKLIKDVSSGSCAVILTSDHGHILCSRGTEIYGHPKIDSGRRCLFGDKFSADERNVLFLEDLSHFRLPAAAAGTKCLMARENYYFIHPKEFKRCKDNTLNCFQYGGVSLEEMIMPLYVF